MKSLKFVCVAPRLPEGMIKCIAARARRSGPLPRFCPQKTQHTASTVGVGNGPEDGYLAPSERSGLVGEQDVDVAEVANAWPWSETEPSTLASPPSRRSTRQQAGGNRPIGQRFDC